MSNWNCTACNHVDDFIVTNVTYATNTHTFAYVGIDYQYHKIAIIFRGTDSEDIKNIILDLQSAKGVNFPGIAGAKVGNGFLKAESGLSAQLRDALAYVSNLPETKGFDYVLSGHSLGGALASIAAVDLLEFAIGRTTLITYGCPRVGNEVFNWHLEHNLQALWRVTHRKDIVIQLPPHTQDFVHPAQEDFYPEASDGRHIVCFMGEQFTCSAGQKGQSVDDHLNYFAIPISNYC